MYTPLLLIHVVAAIALVGPLMLAPRWIALMRTDFGRKALRDLHQQAAVAGWILLSSGFLLLVVQRGAWLRAPWMECSIVLYIGIQAADHWWADRLEGRIERGAVAGQSVLRAWLLVKLAAYLSIVGLMLAKPV